MLISCKRQNLLNMAKITAVVVLLAVIVFYVLPRLVGALWLIEPDEDKMQNNRYQTPMRVECIAPAKLK